MKYMTFNNSCSYAGVANLLEDFEIEIEDYELAIEMKSPYIFKYDEYFKKYISGAMLQNEKYFNYYLRAKDLKFIENKFEKGEVLNYLNSLKEKSMIGLIMDNGRGHGVVYCGVKDGKYLFLNNKRKDSAEVNYFNYSKEELEQRLMETTFIGYIVKKLKSRKENTDQIEEIKDSIRVLDEYKSRIIVFCKKEQSVEALKDAMDSYFRALFLDVYSMMQIIGEEELVLAIGQIRKDFLAAMKLNIPLKLSNYISMEEFKSVIERYKDIIKLHISE